MSSPITIRPATEQDAAALLAIYAPYVVNTAVTFEYDIPSLEEFAGRIRHVQGKYPYLVAEADGGILGYACAGAFHERAAYGWAVTTSIYVHMHAKRQGIGRQLYATLECILQKQGILNLNACIACPEKDDEYLTADSVAFHEKMGYRLVGQFRQCGYKFNRWYHMVWMEKHIAPHVEHQPGVKTVEEAMTGRPGCCGYGRA